MESSSRDLGKGTQCERISQAGLGLLGDFYRENSTDEGCRKALLKGRFSSID